MISALLLMFQPAPVVAITEFHYDPVDGRPGYVEIRNTTDAPVNLRNWRLQRRQVSNETNRFVSTTDLLLPPGGHLVLVAEIAPMVAAFGPGPYHAMARYPIFNRTTADEIRLFDGAGIRIDSIHYHPGIWVRGTAHERRSVKVDANIPENWAPGFSPGLPNTAGPPAGPPRLADVAIREPTDIRLRFDRRLNEASRFCAACVRTEGVPSTFMPSEPDRITVRLATGGTHPIRLTGLSDVFGNVLDDTVLTVTTLYPKPNRDQLVLNELMLWAPTPFIEIHNVTDQAFDLAGMTVNGRVHSPALQTDGFHFPQPIPPGGLAEFTSWPTLGRSSGGIGLRSRHGILLDSIRYSGSTWPFGPDNRSLERIDPSMPGNDPKNWAIHPFGHSRGLPNHHVAASGPLPDPDIIDLLSGKIRIRFPRHRKPEPGTRVEVDGQPSAILPVDPMQADTWWIDSPTGDHVRILAPDRLIGPVPVARMPRQGALLFNEILYQPHQERYSGKPDQPQYVEIHNPTGMAFTLEGIHLTDAPDKNGQVSRIHPVSTSRRWLGPGGYVVLMADTATDWSRTRMHRAFPDTDPLRMLRAHRSTLSLTNSGKAIRLMAGELVIDSMHYLPAWHHPKWTDPSGRSLEKIDPRVASGVASNWTSSAATAGGTPGMPNSVLRMPDGTRIRAGITADPNPFRERQAIHIRADEPDYHVQLRIFDRYGRLIRTLSRDEPLGNGRYWWWDGLRDDGRPPGIGVYIAVADLYGSRSGPKRTLRELLVLAR